MREGICLPPGDPMDGLAFPAALAAAREIAEAQIMARLSPLPGTLAQAMAYACRGGKGLRGFLVLASARLHDVPSDQAAPAAGAIEALHAYSLIHDDLPCMDDDDLRRGQPTVHRKWDEATAVLAGDALQSLAFEMVLQTACPDGARVELALQLAAAAGLRGMVGGQMADIAAETAEVPLTLDQIIALQAGKTGALITWSTQAGAIIAGADATPLRRFGDCLGLAFQIWDDVLDVTGDAATTGKAVGKDAAAGKATFVSLLGLDAARARARDLVNEAESHLAAYGQKAQTLIDAARFVIARDT
jgi:farnesyl diphosphate synthase